MTKKAYGVPLVIACALSIQVAWANPPRYYQNQIAYQGYFKENPTVLTHYEADYTLPQTPAYNPSFNRYTSNRQEPYAPPQGDVMAENTIRQPVQNADEQPQASDTINVPSTKTILYSSECVTVCPLPKDPNSNQPFPKMQQ